MLNSVRKFSVAIAYPEGIVGKTYSLNKLLSPSEEELCEVPFSAQEYTDEVLDLKKGESLFKPMRDDLGDMWIYRLK